MYELKRGEQPLFCAVSMDDSTACPGLHACGDALQHGGGTPEKRL